MLGTDVRGFLAHDLARDGGDAEAAASGVCAELAAHLGSILSMTSLDVRSAAERHVASVAIDEISAGGRTRRTGCDTGDTPAQAAVAAVVDAVVGGGDLVSAGLVRLEQSGEIRAALVGDADGDRVVLGPPALVDRMRQLLLLMEEPGRLEVSTPSGMFRALFTGALDIAIALEPRHSGAVDRWLDRTIRTTGPHNAPRTNGIAP